MVLNGYMNLDAKHLSPSAAQCNPARWAFIEIGLNILRFDGVNGRATALKTNEVAPIGTYLREVGLVTSPGSQPELGET
jgi:hypothetical protein